MKSSYQIAQTNTQVPSNSSCRSSAVNLKNDSGRHIYTHHIHKTLLSLAAATHSKAIPSHMQYALLHGSINLTCPLENPILWRKQIRGKPDGAVSYRRQKFNLIRLVLQDVWVGCEGEFCEFVFCNVKIIMRRKYKNIICYVLEYGEVIFLSPYYWWFYLWLISVDEFGWSFFSGGEVSIREPS